jgi:glucose dehydrogenase
MSYTLFAFTGLVLLLATALLWKRNVTAVQIVRLFMLVLIVSLSSFLVVVGYDQSQLTPVIGLFGAICGYLLGHAPSPPSPTPAQTAAAEKSEA